MELLPSVAFQELSWKIIAFYVAVGRLSQFKHTFLSYLIHQVLYIQKRVYTQLK